jgi:CRP-like cAMP-binding protein
MSNVLLQQASAFLRATPVRGVRPPHLAAVLAATTLRRHGGGELLCTEGEGGDEMFFLVDGSIRVTRKDAKGKERELAVIQAPALVGHMSLVDNSPRSATCTAGQRTVVGVLDRATYNDLLSEGSDRGTALRRVLCASLTRQLVSANGRIRSILHEAADASRRKDEQEDVEDFEVSDTGLMGLESTLAGLNTDVTLQDIDSVSFVIDEDTRRNPKNRR